MARTFTWTTSPRSGLWNTAANWTDNTDGTQGTLAPGSGDTAILPGGAGIQFQIVGGPGSAGSLTAYGNNAIDGTITVGTLTLGSATTTGVPANLDNSDAFQIDRGAAVGAATSVALYANLEADGGLLLSLGGFDVLSGANDLASGGISNDVVVVNGGIVNAAKELTLAAGNLVEDGTATVEVGTAGGAAKGIVTVDPGATFNLGGSITLNEGVTDNGDLVVSNTTTPGVTLRGSVSGTGALDTGANAAASMVNASVSGLARFHLGQNSTYTFFGGSISNAGTVVLDTGSSLTTDALSNDGPVTLAGNASLTAGNVNGSSTIAVGAGGKLTVSGTLSGLSGVTAGNSSVLTFSGAGDTNVPVNLGTNGNVALNLSAGSNIGGAVSGFDSSDLIENRPTTNNQFIINRVTFTPGSGGAPGTLTLLSDNNVVTTVALSGTYAGQTFLTNFTGITYGDSDITLPGAVVTTGIGPGTQTVTGSANRLFKLITGGGNSGALTLTANLALQGAYTASSLSTVGSATGTDDTTDIQANSSLSVSGNANVATNLQLTGAGSAFTVGGLLTLGGDPSYAPQVILAGTASLRAANLTISGATGEFVLGSNTVPDLAVLGNSTAEVGGGNLATAGSIAVDPGATLTLAVNEGEVVAGTLIDDGLVTMANSSQGVQLNYFASSITLSTNVSGTGTLQALGSLLVTGTVSGVAVDVGGSLTVEDNVSGLRSLTLRASTTTSLYGLSYAQALEVGASASLTVGGLAGTGVLTGLASLTLDASASAKFTGTVTNVGSITVGNNGNLEFDRGGSGAGAIALGTGAKLTLVNGAITGWSGISLAGSDTIATFGGNGSIPAISGFNTSDQIDLTTSTFYSASPGTYYTGATWVQNGGSGTLTLTEDGQALQSYTLAGTYTPSQFITYAGGNVEGTSIGTSSLTLANGTQAGLNGATLTGSTGGSFLLLTGAGQQSSLAINGNVAVAGSFTFGSVQFLRTSSTVTTTNAVLIEAGGSIAAGTATVGDTLEVDGAGAVLNVSGNAALNNTTGDGGLIAFNGASVQVGGTTTSTAYDFNTVDFAVDATASMEVGHAGGAALGTLTVDAASTFHTSSGVNIGARGGVVINGTWAADNLASNVSGFGAGTSDDYVWGANVTGSGSLQIAANTFVTVVRSVSGLSSVVASGGGGLTVSGGLINIGAVTINAGSYVTVSGVGTPNFSANTLTLTDATSTSNTARFHVDNIAQGTGALNVGAYDSFFAGGTVAGWSAITAGAHASLEFGGAEQASPITLGAGAVLRLDAGATVSGVVYGFGKSNYLTYGFNSTSGSPIITDATWTAGANGLGTLTLSDDGAVITQLTLAGDYSNERFLSTFAGEGGKSVISLADPPCYCPGTLIRTERGEVPVEELAEGDMVLTVSGVLRPVVWIGRRSYGARFVRRTRSLHPVCIRAGALAPAVPAQDLWVSPQHAIFLGGVLVPARLLVNGSTVVQPAARDDVHYLHVELPAHDVIWANGMAAESFVDDGSRSMFHNAHERADVADLEPLFYAPRVEAGEELEAARQRLRGREAA